MTWSKASTVSLALISVFFLAMHMDVWAMMCGGSSLVGLGEWINHPAADVSRKANWLGILLELTGVVLMNYAIYLWVKLP
jgi:hypothetical protein